MPVIAPQHTWKDADHTPLDDWPADCYVQWGGRGVVFGKAGTYATAFFEAFPKGGGFFRGEGETIADAEAHALRQYRKSVACPEHDWSRRGYTNGGAFCRRCDVFGTPFAPIVTLGEWKSPLRLMELDILMMGDLASGRAETDPRQRRYLRRVALRFAARGVRLPPVPETRVHALDEDDPYAKACLDAVMAWVHAQGGPDAVFALSSAEGVEGLFEAVAERRVRREYADWLESQPPSASA